MSNKIKLSKLVRQQEILINSSLKITYHCNPNFKKINGA